MLKNTENIALRSLQILYIFVLQAEKVTIFEIFAASYNKVHSTLKSSRSTNQLLYLIEKEIAGSFTCVRHITVNI